MRDLCAQAQSGKLPECSQRENNGGHHNIFSKATKTATGRELTPRLSIEFPKDNRTVAGRRELLGHLPRTPASRRKSQRSLPYPNTDARSPTILITVARVMPSLTEEIELLSNCNDTLIQPRIVQRRSAEAGTPVCWQHDTSSHSLRGRPWGLTRLTWWTESWRPSFHWNKKRCVGQSQVSDNDLRLVRETAFHKPRTTPHCTWYLTVTTRL